MKAFITGSYTYGTPNEKSDIDLVVFCSVDDQDILGEVAEIGKLGYSGPSFMFGQLNLIVCTDQDLYNIWETGTRILKRKKDKSGKPISREEACKLFDALRETDSEC